jgi:hypothetical protein
LYVKKKEHGPKVEPHKLDRTGAWCIVADSLWVNVYAPLGEFNLGPDRTICPGDALQLAAPSGYHSYRWQNSDTARAIVVRQKGTYSVEVTDFCGNIKSDTVIQVANEGLQVGT